MRIPNTTTSYDIRFFLVGVFFVLLSDRASWHKNFLILAGVIMIGIGVVSLCIRFIEHIKR